MRELIIKRILENMDYKYHGRRIELDAMSNEALLEIYVEAVS